jgi:threonine dehydratase
MAQLSDQELGQGVWTASAGNMGRGLAWCARERDVACTVVVPQNAPEAKLRPLTELGAAIVTVTREEWFEILAVRWLEGMRGTFVHPGSDERVIAAAATIGAEILEDLPEVETILAPWGSGGLACGIAAAVRAHGASVRVVACEPKTAAPLTSSLAAGEPVVPAFTPTFIDAAGGMRVYPEMFELARDLHVEAVAVPVAAVERAVRVLAEANHVVAEGAGALSVAAALEGLGRAGRICCVISGGNIDASVLASILTAK